MTTTKALLMHCFLGHAMEECWLNGPEPYVIQLYPSSRIGGENPTYFAHHLVFTEIDRQRQQHDADAEFICACAMYLFGNFLVLSPRVKRAEAEQVREILERKSREMEYDVVHPEHAVLLTAKTVRRKASFSTALENALSRRDSREQYEQGLAAVLIVMFFHKHRRKMLHLAKMVSHYARFGGSNDHGGDD